MEVQIAYSRCVTTPLLGVLDITYQVSSKSMFRYCRSVDVHKITLGPPAKHPGHLKTFFYNTTLKKILFLETITNFEKVYDKHIY